MTRWNQTTLAQVLNVHEHTVSRWMKGQEAGRTAEGRLAALYAIMIDLDEHDRLLMAGKLRSLATADRPVSTYLLPLSCILSDSALKSLVEFLLGRS